MDKPVEEPMEESVDNPVDSSFLYVKSSRN